MKNTLFWRLFATFVIALIVTIAVLALIMVSLVRNERRQAYESELLVQARDLAQLIGQNQTESLVLHPGGMLWSYRDSDMLDSTITWKMAEIEENYGAQISRLYTPGTIYRSSMFTAADGDIAVLEQIARLLGGEEVRVNGVFNESLNVVSLGVPYFNDSGKVIGAVILHVDMTSVSENYSDILRYVIIAGVAAMLLGSALAYLIAKSQSAPLKKIQTAVAGFASGDFSGRIEGIRDGEMGSLAESINAMAGELNNLEDSRRTFVANVSHELRSPMTSISGYVQGILDGTIPEGERDKYLNVVLSESQRLVKLVSELLELSRFDSGKLPLELTRFDITALILSVMFKYEQRIEDKGIDVEISFRDQPIFVMADQDRITQVLTNLIDNAVKFTNDGGSILVWAHVVDGACYVSIKNTGAGIGQEDLPFIFDRFYTGNKAHTSGSGTGLGLAIVKKILDQHRQSITVSSTLGETSFVFTLGLD